MGVQVLHSFLLYFRPRKQEVLVCRERVRLVLVGERGGLLAGFVDGPPKVGLQRVDENLDVPFLHVRVLNGSIFVVWAPGSVAPGLLELLGGVFNRVHHYTEVTEPLFGDVSAEERLEAQVHPLEVGRRLALFGVP